MARLIVDFTPAEGALIRLLGLIERRGFRILSVDMAEQDGAARAMLTLLPRDAGRQIPTLVAQIRRLHDVRSVTSSPTLEPLS